MDDQSNHYISQPVYTLEELNEFAKAWLIKYDGAMPNEGLPRGAQNKNINAFIPIPASTNYPAIPVPPPIFPTIETKNKMAAATDQGSQTIVTRPNEASFFNYFSIPSGILAPQNSRVTTLENKLKTNNEIVRNNYADFFELMNFNKTKRLADFVSSKYNAYLDMNRLYLKNSEQDRLLASQLFAKEQQTDDKKFSTVDEAIKFYRNEYNKVLQETMSFDKPKTQDEVIPQVEREAWSFFSNPETFESKAIGTSTLNENIMKENPMTWSIKDTTQIVAGDENVHQVIEQAMKSCLPSDPLYKITCQLELPLAMDYENSWEQRDYSRETTETLTDATIQSESAIPNSGQSETQQNNNYMSVAANVFQKIKNKLDISKSEESYLRIEGEKIKQRAQETPNMYNKAISASVSHVEDILNKDNTLASLAPENVITPSPLVGSTVSEVTDLNNISTESISGSNMETEQEPERYFEKSEIVSSDDVEKLKKIIDSILNNSLSFANNSLNSLSRVISDIEWRNISKQQFTKLGELFNKLNDIDPEIIYSFIKKISPEKETQINKMPKENEADEFIQSSKEDNSSFVISEIEKSLGAVGEFRKELKNHSFRDEAGFIYQIHGLNVLIKKLASAITEKTSEQELENLMNQFRKYMSDIEEWIKNKKIEWSQKTDVSWVDKFITIFHGLAQLKLIHSGITEYKHSVKGMGLDNHVEKHAENSNKMSKHQNILMNKIMSKHVEPISHNDMLDHFLHKQPQNKESTLSVKETRGCGICGGSHNLLVHSKDNNDYTCKQCYDARGGMTHGLFTKRDADVGGIEHSDNVQHKKDYEQHAINRYLAEMKNEPKASHWDNFDNSAKLNKNFMKRIEGDYIMNRDYQPHDTNRLAYLIGKHEHDHDNVKNNKYIRANMQTMIINELSKYKTVEPEIFRYNDLSDYDSTFSAITSRPGTLKSILV